jgi:hypothetical protein
VETVLIYHQHRNEIQTTSEIWFEYGEIHTWCSCICGILYLVNIFLIPPEAKYKQYRIIPHLVSYKSTHTPHFLKEVPYCHCDWNTKMHIFPLPEINTGQPRCLFPVSSTIFTINLTLSSSTEFVCKYFLKYLHTDFLHNYTQYVTKRWNLLDEFYITPAHWELQLNVRKAILPEKCYIGILLYIPAFKQFVLYFIRVC